MCRSGGLGVVRSLPVWVGESTVTRPEIQGSEMPEDRDGQPQSTPVEPQEYQEVQEQEGVLERPEKGASGIPPTMKTMMGKGPQNSAWWSCFHVRYTKLAQRKFADRIVILWKCRKCPKRVQEVIEINMNARKVFTKSTTSSLPRLVEGDE